MDILTVAPLEEDIVCRIVISPECYPLFKIQSWTMG
jgi:hypothetical protein